MGFWFLRIEKTGILELRAIKGATTDLRGPRMAFPRLDQGHIGVSHQCLTTTSSLKTF